MKKLTYILIINVLISSCENKKCYIQDVYVNELIDLNLQPELAIEGSSIFVNGGVEGIIIYHGNGDNYKVYDRNCSYEPCLSCAQIDSVSSGIAYCSCCPSAFLISNTGESINSPALLPLKSYNWTLDANNILRIFN